MADFAFNFYAGLTLDSGRFVRFYKGQDLHIVRNGIPFQLKDFFVGDNALATGQKLEYSIYINNVYIKTFTPTGSTTSTSITIDNVIYEYGEYTKSTGIPMTGPTITANSISTLPAPPTISSIYYRIKTFSNSGGFLGETFVLIHIHDSITDIWLSPNTMTLDFGLNNTRFAVLAKFSDGIIGEITWYPGFSWSMLSTLPPPLNYLSITPSTPGLITFTGTALMSSPPITGTQVFLDASSSYFAQYSPAISTPPDFSHITGNIVIDQGKLSPIQGTNVNTIDSNMNVILLADGFSDSGVTVDALTFDKYAKQIADQFRNSPITSPYNLFDINFWAYYLPGSSGGQNFTGDHIVISPPSGGSCTTMPIRLFIDYCNKIVTYLKSHASGTSSILKIAVQSIYDTDYPYLTSYTASAWAALPTSISSFSTDNVDLSWLVANKGLPGSTDAGKSIVDKTNEWRTVEGTYSPSLPPLYNIVNDLSSTPPFPVSSPHKILHEFVYKMWLLLYNRIVLDFHDTPWGSTGLFPVNETFIINGGVPDLDLNGGNAYSPPSFNLSSLGRLSTRIIEESFNQLISSLTYNSSAIGAQFDASTTPHGKDSRNIITLTKISPITLDGLNHIGNYEYYLSDYTYNFIIVALGPNIQPPRSNLISSAMLCDVVGNQHLPTRPSLPPEIPFVPLNTAVHEFSHNYLLDEYQDNGIAFSLTSSALDGPNETLKSNLVTAHAITSPPGSGTFAKQKIKWGVWPRITKIAISHSALTFDSISGNYKINVQSIYPTLTSGGFIRLEYVILQTVDLFNPPLNTPPTSTPYPMFQIQAINPISPPDGIYQFELTLQAGHYVNIPDFASGAYIISPRWQITTPATAPPIQPYLTLTHPDILAFLDHNTHPTVAIDMATNHDIQKPDSGGLPTTSVIKNYGVKSRLVSLWAGGYEGKYNSGIYHSTGFCIMRNTSAVNATDSATLFPKAPYTANYFCPICKYILVNAIDPLKHPQIDDEYEGIYPK